VSGAYCQTNTQQPVVFNASAPYTSNPGTCQLYNNVPIGGNCSLSFSTLPCQSQGTCQYNGTTFIYTCVAPPQNVFGKACNYSDPTIDATQCPYGGSQQQLVCACNNTCAYVTSTVVSTSCSSKQNARYQSLLNSFAFPGGPALASYSGDRRAVADHICCTYCGTFYQTYLASSYGITVDCAALTITVPKICDNNYQQIPYLQNCGQYVANAAPGVTFSLAIFYLIAMTVLFLN